MRALALFILLVSPGASAADSPARYDLDIHVSADMDVVRISGRWRMPLPRQATQALDFLLTPLASTPIIEARCGDSALPVSGLGHVDEGGDRRWSIRFGKTCSAGRELELRFRYEFTGAIAPQLRIKRDEGFAGSGGELWYPQESYAGREVGRITLDAAADLTGIVTGRRVDRLVRGARASTVFELDTPGKFAFAYGDYRAARRGQATVYSLSRSSGADVDAIATVAAQSSAALTAAFGPLPDTDLRIVEVDFRSQVLGTSESGMLFADPTQMRTAADNPVYWAHELAHQWWGVSVRPIAGSPGATMLTEGLAQYGALLVLEQTEGPDAAAAYRLAGRGADTAQSLAGYRALTAAGPDRAIAEFAPENQEQTLLAHRLATSKGAIALHGFAERFGRDAFVASLRAFHERHRGSRTSWAELEAELVRRFGPEAERYLEVWFHRPGWPG